MHYKYTLFQMCDNTKVMFVTQVTQVLGLLGLLVFAGLVLGLRHRLAK